MTFVKTLLILGGGTAGTVIANKMSHKLDSQEWRIQIVDKDLTHFYQPGFIYVPFGIYRVEDTARPKRDVISKQVEIIFGDIDRIEPQASRVHLERGQSLSYDILVIATGCEIRPDQIKGLVNGGWHKNIFDF